MVRPTRVRHLREDVRLVRHQHDRRAVLGDAGKRTRQVVDAAETAVAERMGELVAEAGQPEGRPVLRLQAHHVVFHQRMSLAAKAPPHAVDVVPPVVIADDAVDAERRRQVGERPAPFGRRHHRGAEASQAGDVVAEEQRSTSGSRLLATDDDLGDARQRHPRIAGMDVGDRPPCGAASAAAGQPRQRQAIARHHQAEARLDGEGIGRQADEAEAAEADRLQECTARKHG